MKRHDWKEQKRQVKAISISRLSFLLVVLGACSSEVSVDELRFNEIQVLGSHNSYKQAIDPELFATVIKSNPALAQSLDYAHLRLEEQLDMGVRALELDVFYDPEGGRYARPLGLSLVGKTSEYDPEGLMRQPGFKVLHAQDIDFRSNCLTFSGCLSQLKHWSGQHPGHLPIMVSINAKDDVIDQPGFVRPLKFDVSAWDALDAEIRAVLGEKLILPSWIRGDAESVNIAIMDSGWPELTDLMNRFLFVLDESTEKNMAYLKGRENAVLFPNMPAGGPDSAVRIVNRPIEDMERIKDLVEQGYLVRTRADADTREARSGDTRRRDAAWSSGAHFVSTDYYLPDTRFESGYSVGTPAIELSTQSVTELTDRSFNCNPVSAALRCARIKLKE